MKTKKTKKVATMLFTVALLCAIVTPVLAASWSMEMRYSVVDGKKNGQTYNLNAGTRTVTGSLWSYYWNNDLTSTVDVNVILYKSNAILPDTNVAKTTARVQKGGSKKTIALTKSGQPKGTYYLYFSKPNNETGVRGSGTIY